MPRQTLHNQVSGKIIYTTKPEPKPLLSTVEETELLSLLLDVASVGYSKVESNLKLWLWQYVAVTKNV